MNIDFHDAEWMFEPKKHSIQMNKVTITTEPLTDIWQRSFYGFKNNNAPRLLLESSENFSFTAKIRINYKKQFDQCRLQPIHFGIYACSPLMSSYIAEFSDFKLEPCQWLAYDED